MRRWSVGVMGVDARDGARLQWQHPLIAPSHLFEGRDLFCTAVGDGARIRTPTVQRLPTCAQATMSWVTVLDRRYGLLIPTPAPRPPLVSTPGTAIGVDLVTGRSASGIRVQKKVKERTELFVRWMATGQTARVADLTDAPSDLSWSPDGRSIAFTDFVPDEKAKLGTAPCQTGRRRVGGASGDHHRCHPYRADGAGYLKAGYTHGFVVSAEGGAPRQLSFGAFNEGRPGIVGVPDARFIFVSGNRTDNWRFEPLHTEVVFRLQSLTARSRRLRIVSVPTMRPIVSPGRRAYCLSRVR